MEQAEIVSEDHAEKTVDDKLMAQVSHMVGHRISGPIATMLGLIELMKMNNDSRKDICPFVDQLEVCVGKLKDNCKELADLVYT